MKLVFNAFQTRLVHIILHALVYKTIQRVSNITTFMSRNILSVSHLSTKFYKPPANLYYIQEQDTALHIFVKKHVCMYV